MLQLQIISTLLRWLAEPDVPPPSSGDPLRHPDITAMTARQVADLPFPRSPHASRDMFRTRKAYLPRCA